MVKARVSLGLEKHMNQLLRTWAGKECTHVQIVEELDDFGQIIDQTRTTSTVYGVIGDASFKGNNYPIGLLQPGDLCGTFLYSDDIIMPSQLTDTTTRQDHIIFQSEEYRIESIEIGYDLNTVTGNHDPIIVKYLLRRITI